VKRFAVHCQECDRVIDRGEEFHRAHPVYQLDTPSIDTAAVSALETPCINLVHGPDAPAVETPDPTPPTCYSTLGCLQSPYCAAHGGCPYNPTPPDVLPSYQTRSLRL
jgi:hypothetical protein